MRLDDILAYLRNLAPENTAMDDDPVGLLIEPENHGIESIVVCLDATPNVVQMAVQKQAQLIVVHHPLIYHPLKKLERGNPISSIAIDLVRNGIGVYAMHTNWDLAAGGINDTLAGKLGLLNISQIEGSATSQIARIGCLPKLVNPTELLEHTMSSLRCSGTSTLRHAPIANAPAKIETVAVCGGAGSSLIGHAIAAGAQAFITSDVRHDQFVDAAERNIFLVDAGHEATEAPGMESLAALLAKELSDVKVAFCSNWN